MKIVVIKNFFENNSGINGGSINLQNCYEAFIEDNYFKNNSADSGGAIFVSTESKNIYYV